MYISNILFYFFRATGAIVVAAYGEPVPCGGPAVGGHRLHHCQPRPGHNISKASPAPDQPPNSLVAPMGFRGMQKILYYYLLFLLYIIFK